jgi:hypothetical protein
MIRCDSFSELPGFLLGTSWTVRMRAANRKKKGKKEKEKEKRT